MRTGFLRVVTAGCLVSSLVVACAARDPEPALSPESGARLRTMKAAEGGFSIVIHPVLVAGAPMRNVAEVLALMFEQSGLTDVDVATMPFVPAADLELDHLAAMYGSFVADHRVDADYALFAEYVGTPEKGVEEVRWIVVDKDGQLVMADRQAPSDADFRRVKPRNPMTCSVLLSERFRTVLDLPEPDEDRAPQGRWAQHWKAASGLPSEEERAAMSGRQLGLRARLRSADVAVLPLLLGDRIDGDAAARLAARLVEEGICAGAAVAGERTFSLEPTPNELKRLWALAHGLRASLKAEPAEAPYTLCAEYLMDPRSGKAHSVHWMLCDARGDWVAVDFQNEYQDDFRSIDPSSIDQCNELVLKRIRRHLAPDPHGTR